MCQAVTTAPKLSTEYHPLSHSKRRKEIRSSCKKRSNRHRFLVFLEARAQKYYTLFDLICQQIFLHRFCGMSRAPSPTKFEKIFVFMGSMMYAHIKEGSTDDFRRKHYKNIPYTDACWCRCKGRFLRSFFQKATVFSFNSRCKSP